MKWIYEKICMNGKRISKLIIIKKTLEQTEINHRTKLTNSKFEHKIVHKSTPKLNWICFAKAFISFYKATHKILKSLKFISS